MKKIGTASQALHIALVLVGTVIGAGFASGAEIMAYFTDYGETGLWAIGMAGLLFFVGTYGTLKIAYENGNTEYGTFTEQIAGKWLGAVLDASTVLSMILGYGVMLAGSGAIFLQQWDLPEVWGSLLMAGAVLATLHFGPEGVIKMNRILTPILIAGIFLVSAYGIMSSSSVTETMDLLLQPLSIFTAQPMKNLFPALESAAIYVSYNMLGATAVLTGLSGYIHHEKQAAKTGVYAACILVLLTFAMGLATFLNYDTIRGIPIPVLGLMRNYTWRRQLYVVVLLGAMYTTAVADGFGLMNRMKRLKRWSEKTKALLMTLSAMILARLGFTCLVEKGYKFLGYLGMAQLILIIIKCISKKETINGKQKRRNGKQREAVRKH